MSVQKNKNKKYISVFIPVFNGDKYLGECIESIINQELPTGYSLEIIIIDSGSTDRSLDIINQYKKHVILIEIPNKDFTHGGTRQKAAEIAKGEFILYLTQDATPSDYRWLLNMVEPFYLSDRVGCVFGRQVPRRNAAPTIKREVSGVFDSMGAPDSIVIHRHKSLVDNKNINAINTFFSDANSAVRRSLLIGEVPFRKVHYAEDQALAEDMQKKGFLKAYSPQGIVWHSNEYTAKEYSERKFDEFTGLYDSLGVVYPVSKKSLLFGWIRPTIKDIKFIKIDPSYGRKAKIKWLLTAPLYNMGSIHGQFKAFRLKDNLEKRKHESLEHKMRKNS
jgi:rhamnosyltransferase